MCLVLISSAWHASCFPTNSFTSRADVCNIDHSMMQRDKLGLIALHYFKGKVRWRTVCFKLPARLPIANLGMHNLSCLSTATPAFEYSITLDANMTCHFACDVYAVGADGRVVAFMPTRIDAELTPQTNEGLGLRSHSWCPLR